MFISGELLEAQQAARKALLRVSTPAWSQRYRTQLANILLYQGHTEQAIDLLTDKLAQNTEGETAIRHDLVLAAALAIRSKTDQSALLIKRVEDVRPTGILHAELLGVEGTLAKEQGNNDLAELSFQSALSDLVLETRPSRAATFLQIRMWMNLGVVALREQHYEDALTRFQRASMLANNIGAGQALEIALGNIGWIYYQTGEFEKALANAEQAEAKATAIGASVDQIQWLTNSGMCQFHLGNQMDALKSFRTALQLAEQIDNSELIFDTHVALSSLLLRTVPEEARHHLEQARLIARQRHNNADEMEVDLIDAIIPPRPDQLAPAEAQLLLLIHRAKALPALQWQAQGILARHCAAAGRKADARLWFQRAIETYHRQRASLTSVELQLPFLENGSDLYLDYMELLIREHKPEAALQVLDRSRAETLAEGLGVTESRGPQTVQSAHSAAQSVAARLGGTILVYCLRPERSYLWAVTARRQRLYTLPGSAAVLPLVARHTQAILASKDLLTQQDSTARALYDALLRPAAPLLPPGGRVFLIADKGLDGLNFETLVPPGPRPHYWIEDATLTNARSLRLLAAGDRRAAPAPAPKLLLIGDPVYRPQEYTPLPHAAAEMSRVAAHFPPADRTAIAGPQASPAVYAGGRPAHSRYIHFVAHATADQMNPLDSAIILSHTGPATEASPDKLYAGDILKQPLTADLVTLSACYGSGTRNYSGEGLVGLVWAFLRAGAHSVIGALWEVSDASTPELMDTLYAGLLHGDRPDAALRSAKLAMLHGDGIFRKPLYWAPFQLYAGR